MTTIPKIRWTAEENAILIANLPLGLQHCITTLNRTEKAIRHHLNRLNLKLPTLPKPNIGNLSNEQIQWVCHNYPVHGIKYCANHLNIPKWIIENIAQKNNLKYSRIPIPQPILFDTPQKAYLLGLLWGDGYLIHPKQTKCKYISLQLVNKDFIDIKQMLFELGDWRISEKKPKNRQIISTATIKNGLIGLYFDTLKFGIKSQISCSHLLELLNPIYHKDFLLGLIDADGCFYYNAKNHLRQFSLAGSYTQDWTGIENLFLKLNIEYKIVRRIQKRKNAKDSGSSIVRVTNEINLKKLIRYIHPNLDYQFGILRKYNRTMTLFNSFKKGS